MIARLKYLLTFSLGALVVVACGGAPASVHERILDVDSGMLRGMVIEDDRPLAFCKTTTCYVYEDYDVRRVKKYIVGLEEQLRAMQKRCK